VRASLEPSRGGGGCQFEEGGPLAGSIQKTEGQGSSLAIGIGNDGAVAKECRPARTVARCCDEKPAKTREGNCRLCVYLGVVEKEERE